MRFWISTLIRSLRMREAAWGLQVCYCSRRLSPLTPCDCTEPLHTATRIPVILVRSKSPPVQITDEEDEDDIRVRQADSLPSNSRYIFEANHLSFLILM